MPPPQSIPGQTGDDVGQNRELFMPPGEAAEILSVRNVSRGSNAQIRPLRMMLTKGKEYNDSFTLGIIPVFIPYTCIPGHVTNASSRKTIGGQWRKDQHPTRPPAPHPPRSRSLQSGTFFEPTHVRAECEHTLVKACKPALRAFPSPYPHEATSVSVVLSHALLGWHQGPLCARDGRRGL